jgi:predicted MPP superfamily phosphohydrolase
MHMTITTYTISKIQKDVKEDIFKMIDPRMQKDEENSLYPQHIEITTHYISLPNLPDSLINSKIVQLSDLHRRLDIPDDILRHAVHKVNALHPDFIALTGDYVDADRRNVLPSVHILSHLRASSGIFAVMGNHDHRADSRLLTSSLRAAGIEVLHNSAVLTKDGLWFAGVDDLLVGDCQPQKALQKIPNNAPLIFLSHNADVLKMVNHDRALIMLSGHTHGGQFTFPILTPRVICMLHLRTHFVHGWYSIGASKVYVNRGIGVSGWGPMAKRHRCLPEITQFILQKESSSQN